MCNVCLFVFVFSRQLLQELTTSDLSNGSFPFSTHQVIDIADKPVRALRLTFVGELGWELHIPESSCLHVYNALMEVGRQYGIMNAGYRSIDSLSIEKGYRHWHEDVRADDSPLEAGLGFTCKLKSNVPFLGREAIEKEKARGLMKKLCCFTVDKLESLCLFICLFVLFLCLLCLFVLFLFVCFVYVCLFALFMFVCLFCLCLFVLFMFVCLCLFLLCLFIYLFILQFVSSLYYTRIYTVLRILTF